MFGYVMAKLAINEFANSFVGLAVFLLNIDNSIVAFTSKPNAFDWY